MHETNENLANFLRRLTLLVLALILCLGLWPFNVRWSDILNWMTSSNGKGPTMFPQNNVGWLSDEPGLRFRQYASIFSDKALEFSAGTDNAGGSTLEVWIEPTSPNYVTTVLAFSTERDPLQFSLLQLENSLEVRRQVRDNAGRIDRESILVEHVFPFRKIVRLLITVSSGPNRTAVYVNGGLRLSTTTFLMRPGDLTGRMVFGDSPHGRETWIGNLRGVAIYPQEISAGQAARDYDVWNSETEFPALALPPARALYLFREKSGRTARSSIEGAPDLYLPETFRTMRPTFLKPFWIEYESSWQYLINTLLNVAAFLPLGFFFYGYLRTKGNTRKPLLVALAAGFLLSLTVEVLQYFLPLRDSGTTDLITNTGGALVGALLFRIETLQNGVRQLASKHLAGF